MRNVEITINGTITIKVNDDVKAKHHHDNNRKHTTNKTGSKGLTPEKVLLPDITGRVIKHKVNDDTKVKHHDNKSRFFVYGECDAITARELIVRDGKIFALDTFTLKGIEAKSVTTPYATIVPDGKGGLKQFSDRHGRWYPCSVQNGIYTIKNVMEDVKKYDL